MPQALSYNDTAAYMWTLTAVCIILTIGRYAIRYQVRQRLFPDDFAHLSALVWLIATISIVQAMFGPAKYVDDPSAPPPESQIAKFRRLQVWLSVSFYLSHWSVKFSFLLFYRQLFWVSERFMRCWWGVVAFVFVGFWVPMAGILTVCGSPENLYKSSGVLTSNSPTLANKTGECNKHRTYQQHARIYMASINVSTDLAVMALPLFMLQHLNIPLGQKIGLTFLFCLCFVTITLEVLRVVASFPGTIYDNTVLYGNLESIFTVMICCIPTYRSLLNAERRTKVLDCFSWLSLKGQSRISVDRGRDVEMFGIGQSQSDVKIVREWEQTSESKDTGNILA